MAGSPRLLPLPALRGERAGVRGLSPRAVHAVSAVPPHPDRKGDPTSPRKRGEVEEESGVKRMKAIIVGGGIGGLTTALMLRARGIDCELFEQSDTIRELGVGINTLPHAIRELAGLGLLDRLDAAAIRTDELYYLNRHGQEVWREPRGLDAGHDVPQFSVHRGRLQSVIHRAVEERLGKEVIHTGCRLGAFTQDEGGVTAYFFDRAGFHVKTA